MALLAAVLGGFSQQQGFREQKGQLQEDLEVQAANNLTFYPKFHCVLNFIERFWCAAEWYAGGNCEYSLEGLRKIVPAALDSVSAVSINRYYNHCTRVIDAHADGFKGTRGFTARVYKGHRQVVDKTSGKDTCIAIMRNHSTFLFGFRN